MKPTYYIIIAILCIYMIHIINISQFFLMLLFGFPISIIVALCSISAFFLNLYLEQILEYYDLI